MSERGRPDAIERRLQVERPAARSDFRLALRQRLLTLGAAGVGRPRWLLLAIAGLVVIGAALLLTAVAGLFGGGPLAPG